MVGSLAMQMYCFRSRTAVKPILGIRKTSCISLTVWLSERLRSDRIFDKRNC